MKRELLLTHFKKLKDRNKLIPNLLKQSKIDIVYTFVDFQDKSFQNKIKKYKSDFDLIRYQQFGEIYFSLKTLEFFMKNYVNNIYIVTFDQKLDHSKISKWIENKIKYINHSDIIPSKYLPTFNSIVIECFLHKIPDITNTFLYINDDMNLGNYINLNDIFNENNVPYVFIKYLKTQSKKNPNEPWLDYYLNGYELIQSKYNIYCNIKPTHCAYVMRKDVCEKTWDLYNFELDNSISKFRESKNVNFWFLCYLTGIYFGMFEPKLTDDKISIYFHCDTEKKQKKIEYIKKIFKIKPLFFNINNIDEKCYIILKFFIDNYLKLFKKNDTIKKLIMKDKINKKTYLSNMISI